MTGIEKVARAIWELDQARPFKDFSNNVLYGHAGPVSWEEATSPGVVQFGPDQFRENTRAALLALREPSEAIRAHIKLLLADDRGNPVDNDSADREWHHLIDALLNEKAP